MSAIKQSVKEQNHTLSKISIMTASDAKEFCKILSFDDVMTLALAVQSAHYGDIPVSEYQKLEKELITKYQFRYHKNPNYIEQSQ